MFEAWRPGWDSTSNNASIEVSAHFEMRTAGNQNEHSACVPMSVVFYRRIIPYGSWNVYLQFNDLSVVMPQINVCEPAGGRRAGKSLEERWWVAIWYCRGPTLP